MERILIRLTEEEFKKIIGIEFRGNVKVRTFKYLSSNIDRIIEAEKLHRKLLQDNVLKAIRYRKEFRDVNAYIVGEEKAEFLPFEMAQYEHEVRCYEMLPGAHCVLEEVKMEG